MKSKFLLNVNESRSNFYYYLQWLLLTYFDYVIMMHVHIGPINNQSNCENVESNK